MVFKEAIISIIRQTVLAFNKLWEFNVVKVRVRLRVFGGVLETCDTLSGFMRAPTAIVGFA
jgi:hypothetical protein